MNNLPAREFYTILGGACLLAANAGFINVVSMAGIFPGTHELKEGSRYLM
jgi:hypothetical protein